MTTDVLVVDLFIDLVIGFTLSYEFENVANEAERYITEKQSEHSNFITEHKDFTGICIAHDSLSRKLKILNEPLQVSSGFVVVSSIVSCCIATYGIINGSWNTDLCTFMYVAALIWGCLLYLVALIWCGLRLNKSVSIFYNNFIKFYLSAGLMYYRFSHFTSRYER